MAKKTILGLEQRTFIALAVFVVCGGGAAIALHRPAEGDRPMERAWPAFKAKSVDHLQITASGKTTSFQKNGDTWQVTAPVSDKADQDSVTSFVSRLASVRFEGVVADKADSQASYEVTPKKGVLVVAQHGDQVLAKFLVGKQDGINSYVRDPGHAEIYAVDGIARYDVAKAPNAWRDHTIFPMYKSEDVAQIEVKTPAGTTVVKKAPPASKNAAPVPAYQATWTVVSSPVKDELADMDTTIAPGIATSLAGLRAGDIADGLTPQQAGLAPSQGTITLTMQDGTTHYVLNVGAAKGDDRYVSTPTDTRIFTVPQSTLERIYVTPQQFRSKDMADVKADQVTAMEITTGGEQTTLTHDGTKGWKAEEVTLAAPGKTAAKPTTPAVDSAKVSNLADVLDGLKAVLYSDETDPKVTGLDKPATIAKFTLKDKSTVELDIGATKGTTYNYATISTHPGDVFLISSFTATRVAKKASELAKN